MNIKKLISIRKARKNEDVFWQERQNFITSLGTKDTLPGSERLYIRDCVASVLFSIALILIAFI